MACGRSCRAGPTTAVGLAGSCGSALVPSVVGMTETLPVTTPIQTPAAAAAPAADPVAPRRPRGVRRVLLESGYSLSAFPIALVSFVVVVVGLALGVGLAILVGGVLLISLGILVARGFARLERLRLRGMLARPAPQPSYVRARPGDGFWRRSLTPLRDPQSWLDVVWSVVGLVTGTLAFAVTLVWWTVAGAGLTYWFWQLWLPDRDPGDHALSYYLGFGDGRTADSLVQLGVGVVALLTLPLGRVS